MLEGAAFRDATPVIPELVDLRDPESRGSGATRWAAFYAYRANYLLDLTHAMKATRRAIS